jgi:hypothetical protein
MSKAQKLINRAVAILKSCQQPGGPNHQKALVEIRTLLDRTEDDGVGTASEKVKLARKTMQQHSASAITNGQAVSELSRIFQIAT